MSDKTLVHDISYWQGNLSKYWQMFKDKGCAAVICQSTNGLGYQRYFHDTAPQIKEQGFLVGSYHYYRQHIQDSYGNWIACDPVKQADNYFNWVTKSGIPMDLPPILDVENGGNPQGVSAGGVDKCLRRIEERFGRIPIIYSNPNILNGLAITAWKKYPLWIAHYTTEDKIYVPKVWDKWTIWQFSDKITYDIKNSADVVTERKPIDHNWFNGDLMDLYAFCGLGEIEPPTEPPIVVPQDEYVRVVNCEWLSFRNRPEVYPGDRPAIGPRMSEPAKVLERKDGWLKVELSGGDVGWISERYTRLV